MFRKKSIDKQLENMVNYLQKQNQILLEALLDCKGVKRIADINLEASDEKKIELSEYDEIYGAE